MVEAGSFVVVFMMISYQSVYYDKLHIMSYSILDPAFIQEIRCIASHDELKCSPHLIRTVLMGSIRIFFRGSCMHVNGVAYVLEMGQQFSMCCPHLFSMCCQH